MKKNSFKLLTTALVLGTALSSASALAGQKSDPFAGPYVGLQAGFGFSDPKLKHDDAVLAQYFGEKSYSANGGVVGLFAGYGQTFDHFYLGSEIYFDARNIRNKITQSIRAGANPYTTANEIENKHAYGILLKPGFTFDNTLLYANLGYEISKFEAKQFNTFNNGGVVSNENFKKSKNLNGFVFGGGIEHALSSSPNWKLRGDYKYITYEDFKFRAAETVIKKLDESIITVGASYSF